MKKPMILVGMLAIGYANAQDYSGKVGINTDAPQATLDITAKTTEGQQTEGLLIPRVTYAKMEEMKANLTEKHHGVMVFMSDALDLNTYEVKEKYYDTTYATPYYVYDATLKMFVPFSPTGLTAVRPTTTTPSSIPAYELSYYAATKAVFNDPGNIGEGSVNLTPWGLGGGTANTQASGKYSFSAQGGEASGEKAFAIQDGQASGAYATSILKGVATGDASFALGEATGATGNNSVAIGYAATAEGDFSIAISPYSLAYAKGEGSISFGGTASGEGSISFREGIASGERAFAMQHGVASGKEAFAIQNGEASGEKAFAMQWGKAIGPSSIAMLGAEAIGSQSIAMGYSSIAEGEWSTAIGGYTLTYAKGERSMALGGKAIGDYSFATTGATANGLYSVAIGNGTNSYNKGEVALGYDNFSTDNEIVEDASSLQGIPKDDKQLFSIGNGNNSTSSASFSNAIVVLRNAKTGIGLPTDTTTPANSKPTEMLDVNGNIRVRGNADSVVEGGQCANVGTITFHNDNFYGCKSTGWVLLNN